MKVRISMLVDFPGTDGGVIHDAQIHYENKQIGVKRRTSGGKIVYGNVLKVVARREA